jgi:hypothetical protein
MKVPPKALARVEKPLVISFIAADGLERDLQVPMPLPERGSP